MQSKSIATKPNKEIRCPECDSKQIYHRVSSEDYRCQRCGAVFGGA